MKTQSLGSILIPAAALLVIVLAAACVHSDPDMETWHGLARNSCGPADGPAVSIVLDTAEFLGCNANHAGEFQMLLADHEVDGLKPGRVLIDTQTICPLDKCGNRTVLRIEILSADSSSLQTEFRIEADNGDGVKKVRTGKAVLAKCRERPMCG